MASQSAKCRTSDVVDNDHSASRGYLIGLPLEIQRCIFSELRNIDIKNLRLTCRSFYFAAPLRLKRVFLSANPRDVEVFRQIAAHETFRKDVVEIVWDETRLRNNMWLPLYFDEGEEGQPLDTHQDVPPWFATACRYNAHYYEKHQAPSKLLSLPKSWSLYQDLVAQQEAVVASQADAKALTYGLQRFPSLKRVIITPAAHGTVFKPLYPTPMIRSLPFGMDFPIEVSRGWPTIYMSSNAGDEPPPEALPWVLGGGEPLEDFEEWSLGMWGNIETYKDQWRGFRIVSRALAQEGAHHVTELVLDERYLETGLNPRIFDQPCEESDNFASLLRRPGFRRLDLAFLAGVRAPQWQCYRSGLLREALAGATGLQHFSLHTNVEEMVDGTQRLSAGHIDHLVPLRTILPVDRWPRLRHLGLSKFLVVQADLLALLAALPPTLRSVELSFLLFLDGGGDYRGLLHGMRDTLGWRGRPAGERPRVSIAQAARAGDVPGRAEWADDDAVGAFLYGDGACPFGSGRSPNVLREDMRTERNLLDPDEEWRPWR